MNLDEQAYCFINQNNLKNVFNKQKHIKHTYVVTKLKWYGHDIILIDSPYAK